MVIGCTMPHVATGPSPRALLPAMYSFAEERPFTPPPEWKTWFEDYCACTGNKDQFERMHWFLATKMFRWQTPLLGIHRYFSHKNQLHSLIMLERAVVLGPRQSELKALVLHEYVHRLHPFGKHGGRLFQECGVSG
jgi:hypothetical protein